MPQVIAKEFSVHSVEAEDSCKLLKDAELAGHEKVCVHIVPATE